MLPEIEKLLVIQDRDTRIRNLEKEIAALPEEEEDAREKLKSDTAAVEKAKKAYQENEVAMKNLELDIETRRNSIARLKVQQFETKKNEEFRAMGDEILNYEKEITSLEDQELELMEAGESLQATLNTASATLKETNNIVDEDIEAIKQREKNFRAEINSLEEDRNELATHLEPELLSLYDRLFKSKPIAAVVRLRGGQCKGCHVKVTKSTEVAVKSENAVTHCENCGRILYPAD